jgi:hypothetical protein
MKTIAAIAAVTLIAISSIAHAGDARALVPAHESDYVPQSATRAEVLADLAMWKKAGLLKYWRGENTPDTFSREYRAAYARYLRMRHDGQQSASGK